MGFGEWMRAALIAPLGVASGLATAATVDGVRVFSGPEATRVVFELSGPVEHKVFALSGPERLVVDLAKSSARRPLSLPEPRGVVAAAARALESVSMPVTTADPVRRRGGALRRRSARRCGCGSGR